PVEPATVEAAVELTCWFLREALRVYALVGETREEADDRKAVEWIRRQGHPVTARDLHRGHQSRYPKSINAALHLQRLAEAGALRCVDLPPGPRGGRPTEGYVVREDPNTLGDETAKPPDGSSLQTQTHSEEGDTGTGGSQNRYDETLR